MSESNNFEVGQFVSLKGSGIGCVVGLHDGEYVPEDHIAVWFGAIDESGRAIVHTVPAEYFRSAPPAIYQH